jgi:hypothetical protein
VKTRGGIVRRWLAFTIILILFGVSGALSGNKIMEIYNSISAMSNKNTPASYKVKIENDNFNAALDDLPEDILTGQGRPTVQVYFNRGEGVRIIIENIKIEYASLFSMYEEYFKFSGISKVQNPSEFKEIIDKDKVSFLEEDGDTVVVKAWDPDKEEKDNNFALFTFDKKKWVIRKAVYYLDGNPYVQAENRYKVFGKYYMPYEIVLKNLVENSSDTFLFTNYRFNQ